jgi:hypothetical protein
MPTTKAQSNAAKSLADYTLSDDDRAIICLAINHFGRGAHPYADTPNLPYFTATYTRSCLNKARASGKLTNEGNAAIDAALSVLV